MQRKIKYFRISFIEEKKDVQNINAFVEILEIEKIV